MFLFCISCGNSNIFNIMAVPKRKTTPSKRNHRRSHDFLRVSNLIECSNCGELALSHQICLSCGYYNKKEVIRIESDNNPDNEE